MWVSRLSHNVLLLLSELSHFRVVDSNAGCSMDEMLVASTLQHQEEEVKQIQKERLETLNAYRTALLLKAANAITYPAKTA
jgi:hypothetical protein